MIIILIEGDVQINTSVGSVIQVDTPDASTRAFDKAICRIDISAEAFFNCDIIELT